MHINFKKYLTSAKLLLIPLSVTIILSILVKCAEKQTISPDNSTPRVSTISQLHAEGRWILDKNNKKVILRGVNLASMEWNSNGENMLQSLQVAADSWLVNLVRIPLSQDRWFGKASEQNDQGKAYQTLVSAIVDLGAQKGVYVLLELHWNDANVWGQYIGQHEMPDSNSQIFLQDLARTFADHPAVLIGLYNEPHDVSWNIWRNGGTISELWTSGDSSIPLTYEAVGFQALYESVRSAGANNNLIVIGGLDWAFDLRGILQGYAITGFNIIYDTHPYPWKDKDWDGKFGNVGSAYPLLAGEWGGNDTTEHHNYGLKMATYLRGNKFCWTAWDFHPGAGPSLISNWDYQPTWFGELVMRELQNPVAVE